jgi:hypothetical protein
MLGSPRPPVWLEALGVHKVGNSKAPRARVNYRIALTSQMADTTSPKSSPQ